MSPTGKAATSSAAEKDSPSVTFAVAGRLDIPSRRDPQLLEVARIDLAADYFAKAVPVLTPRVYRLAKLTNKSEVVLLPGEATVYVGTDFVGRMRLPLVAAGEPFIAGFGVDPQLQVSRRLVRKSRSVQGGNQIFDYEFRLGLRNYRPGPVKLQLWDRLPKPQGEAVAVNLVKTSVELSTDPAYLRTARTDNLLALGHRGAARHDRRQDASTSTTSFAWNTPATFLSLASSPADCARARSVAGPWPAAWAAWVECVGERQFLQLAAQLSSAVSRPVLSPKPSTFAPIRSSIDT